MKYHEIKVEIQYCFQVFFLRMSKKLTNRELDKFQTR
jgi:hypothetical protein